MAAVAICVFELWLFWGRPHEETGPDGTVPSAAGAGPAALPGDADALPDTAAAVIEEAGRLAALLVELYPNDADAYEVTARMHFSLGDTAKAVAAWEKCLTLRPRYVHAFHGLGLVASKHEDHAKAAEMFGKVLELAPNATEPAVERATALTKLGRWEEAVALLEPALKRDPVPLSILTLLGKAYLHLNQPKKAKPCFEAILRGLPDDEDARYGIATACARLGETQRAKEELARFKAARSKTALRQQAQAGINHDVNNMRETLATIYTSAGEICLADRPERSEQAWRRAAVLAPKDTQCRERLSRFYIQIGRVEQAIGILEQLVAIDRTNSAYRQELNRLRVKSLAPLPPLKGLP